MRAVVLDNLRSAWNVGSVFRTAAALNYDKVLLCGVTITPPAKKLKETSRGMEDVVPWQAYKTTSEALQELRGAGYHIVALESGEKAKMIQDWDATKGDVAWVVGNEAMGISEEVLSSCDDMVALPMVSEQSSINVSCAFAAASYQDFLSASRD